MFDLDFETRSRIPQRLKMETGNLPVQGAITSFTEPRLTGASFVVLILIRQ